MHYHDDRLIKSCPVCQKKIKEINKAGAELNKKGAWKFFNKRSDGLIGEWKPNN